jgi:hypothetical protein
LAKSKSAEWKNKLQCEKEKGATKKRKQKLIFFPTKTS